MPEHDRALTRRDLESLHEALTYMRKRVFEPGELVRVRGMIQRLEDILLDQPESARFRLSPPELETLDRQLAAYTEAMTQRGASQESRDQAREIQALRTRIGGRPPRKRSWLQKLFGKRD